MTASFRRSPSPSGAGSEPEDLSTGPLSLFRAVLARRHEYVRRRSLRLKIGTWNVAACPGADKDIANWFIDGVDIENTPITNDLEHRPAVPADSRSVRLDGGGLIDIYVLGLQEIVDLNATRNYMNRAVYVDNGPMEKWQAAVGAAMPSEYKLIVAEQMTGILLLVYASPRIAPSISNVSTKQIGTGLLGYFGNKGAVITRLVLGETTRLVFINCHLASGTGSGCLDWRCWDAEQIINKTQFDPVMLTGVTEDLGQRIGEEDFAFWFGDLNFRLEGLPGDDIRRLLMLHTRGEYSVDENQHHAPLKGDRFIIMRNCESDDGTSTTLSMHSRDQSFDSQSSLPNPYDFPQDPSQDPASLQATLDSLLPHDQLRRVIKQRRVFHDGWREGHIAFLPSYKYDIGTIGLFDSSEKQRAPSWCDRILYRTRRDKHDYEQKARDNKVSRQKDEELTCRGVIEDDDVLFNYDPDTNGDDKPNGKPGIYYDEYDETTDSHELSEVVTKDRLVEHIHQELYTSHQRVTSSDHKPIVSVFTLDYDAVVPELKAQIHAEVARELDRAENEGRPGITVMIEGDQERAIDFGDIAFLEKKSTVLTIANTSSVVASLTFVERPTGEDGELGATAWLTTSFGQAEEDATDRLGSTVTLEPGETVLAHVEAQFSDISQLRALNDGRARVEDILVLRVEQGCDHFIPFQCKWLPTCLGRSIDELIRVPDGKSIRAFTRERGIKGAIPYDWDVHHSAPRELIKLMEAAQTLAERCAAEEAILEDMELPRQPGWPLDTSTWAIEAMEDGSVKADIVAALDTNRPITSALPARCSTAHKLELVCAVLLLFLTSLTDGLVPPHILAKLSASLPKLTALPHTAWPEARSQVIEILATAPNHNIAFIFLTATISRIAAELSAGMAEAKGPSGLGRRLTFRKGVDDGSRKRRARERKYAEILGPLAFRASYRDKTTRDMERIIMEMFLSRDVRG